jgi:ribulose-5-phosphate 4-epimerase/fuculose-1-phosphate aldolase
MTCGGTVDEAVAYFHALEQACQAQLLAEAAAANGCQKRLINDTEAAFTKGAAGTAAVMFTQFKPEYQMLLKETGGEFLE